MATVYENNKNNEKAEEKTEEIVVFVQNEDHS